MDDVRLRYPHFSEETDKYFSGEIRSWLGVPLISKDSVIGMFALDKHVPNYYTEAHATSAMTFANHIAITLANYNLFNQVQQQRDELERQRDELQKLYQVSQLISSSLDSQMTLKNIVLAASQVCNSDHTGVVLVDKNLSVVSSIEDHELGKPLHERIRLSGVTERILRGREAVFVDSVHPNDETHNAVVRERGFRSYAGLPIVAQDEVKGVLYVHSYEEAAFQEQRELLQTFCNHVAIALNNSDQYWEAENRKSMLTKLVDAESQLIGITEPDKLYNACASLSG